MIKNILIGIFLVAVILCGAFAIWFSVDYEASKTEIETYTIGCEISQMAYAEEAISKTRTKPVYKMGLRCDDFATTLDITAEQFAMYIIGDVVEVEVTIYEWKDGHQETEYRLLGLHK